MGEQVEREQGKPRPAVGLWWSFDGGEPDVIASTQERYVYFKRGACPLVCHMAEDPRWRCVGISTPHGRVMVGERRRSPCGAVRVVRSVEGCAVRMPLDGDDADDAPALWLAATVVGWPVVPVPERGSACQCGAAKPAFCVMCPGCAAEVAGGFPGAFRAPMVYATTKDVSDLLDGLPPNLRAMVSGSFLDTALEKASASVEEYAARYPGLPRPVVVAMMPERQIAPLASIPWDLSRAKGRLDSRERGPGIVALSLPPAHVAVEIPELPEGWQRWGLP